MPDNNYDHDDEELLSSILEEHPGWQDLLAELLQRHRRDLLTRCYVYLRNQQDAEDAMQETEFRVFRAIHTFRREASFRTWLFAIADRQCHDLARKRARHLLGDHTRALIEIHEESRRRSAESAFARDLVKKVLGRIPRDEREILMLRYYVDLSLRDMADYLGLGLSATKMRLYRALDSLGARMESEQHLA